MSKTSKVTLPLNKEDIMTVESIDSDGNAITVEVNYELSVPVNWEDSGKKVILLMMDDNPTEEYIQSLLEQGYAVAFSDDASDSYNPVLDKDVAKKLLQSVKSDLKDEGKILLHGEGAAAATALNLAESEDNKDIEGIFIKDYQNLEIEIDDIMTLFTVINTVFADLGGLPSKEGQVAAINNPDAIDLDALNLMFEENPGLTIKANTMFTALSYNLEPNKTGDAVAIKNVQEEISSAFEFIETHNIDSSYFTNSDINYSVVSPRDVYIPSYVLGLRSNQEHIEFYGQNLVDIGFMPDVATAVGFLMQFGSTAEEIRLFGLNNFGHVFPEPTESTDAGIIEFYAQHGVEEGWFENIESGVETLMTYGSTPEEIAVTLESLGFDAPPLPMSEPYYLTYETDIVSSDQEHIEFYARTIWNPDKHASLEPVIEFLMTLGSTPEEIRLVALNHYGHVFAEPADSRVIDSMNTQTNIESDIGQINKLLESDGDIEIPIIFSESDPSSLSTKDYLEKLRVSGNENNVITTSVIEGQDGDISQLDILSNWVDSGIAPNTEDETIFSPDIFQDPISSINTGIDGKEGIMHINYDSFRSKDDIKDGAPQHIKGQFEDSISKADGSQEIVNLDYEMISPVDWQDGERKLVIMLKDKDANAVDKDSQIESLLGKGFAVAFIDKEGGRYHEEYVVSLIDEFNKQVGEAEKVMLWGEGESSDIALAVAEQHPDLIDGVLLKDYVNKYVQDMLDEINSLEVKDLAAIEDSSYNLTGDIDVPVLIINDVENNTIDGGDYNTPVDIYPHIYDSSIGHYTKLAELNGDSSNIVATRSVDDSVFDDLSAIDMLDEWIDSGTEPDLTGDQFIPVGEQALDGSVLINYDAFTSNENYHYSDNMFILKDLDSGTDSYGIIQDFKLGKDVLNLSNLDENLSFEDLSISKDEGNTTISFTSNENEEIAVTLEGNLNLDEDDFIL